MIKVVVFISFLTVFVRGMCPNHCNGQGDCSDYSSCICHDAWRGADCSLKICPKGIAWSDMPTGTDTAHALAECSNRGICDEQSGLCACAEGFEGGACERLACDNLCNNLGDCKTLQYKAETSRNENSVSYVYDSIWDSDKINSCMCDPNYSSYDCRNTVCPKGDDPLTTGQVNAIQIFKCVASAGSFVLYYKGFATPAIPWSANVHTVREALESIPVIHRVTVSFSQTAGTACQSAANVVFVEFISEFGDLPSIVGEPDDEMSADGGSISVSADGITAYIDTSNNRYVSTVGTKETDACANRGLCVVADGQCLCYNTNLDAYSSSDGYGNAGYRGDCGFVSSGTTVSTCPGAIECSAHGFCDSTGGTWRCTCAEGWVGGDCSERTCPTGLSWTAYPSADNVAHMEYTECSDMGWCDSSSGLCLCRTGFYGSACQYMGCGDLTQPCSSHGKCLSMTELAQNADVNGDYAGFTYGLDPNSADTWDGSRIHGCLCDEGFEGYDCSLSSCPIGDDPATYNDHHEVQILRCRATGGTFTLTFRQHTTPDLDYDITAGELQAALEALPSINANQVRVTFSLDGSPPEGTLTTVQPPLRISDKGSLLIPPEVQAPFVTEIPNNDTNTTELNAIPNYEGAHINTFCQSSWINNAYIHFIGLNGDVPDITWRQWTLIRNGRRGKGKIKGYTDGVEIDGVASIKGTTEKAVCNNRGLCNQRIGVCECFAEWGSSDGIGGKGNLGDCAWRKDFVPAVVSQ